MAGIPLPSNFNLFPIPTVPGELSLDWIMVDVLGCLIVIMLAPIFWRFFNFQIPLKTSHSVTRPFPWWGWLTVVWTLSAWWLAWSRFSWFEPLQPHTFLMLWFGYIGTINALTYQKTGRSYLTHQPGFYGALFVLSSGFWWIFEYLNQFVRNWHYVGVPVTNEHEAMALMSLAFSTVLPAVWGTYEWLATFPRLTRPFENWHEVIHLNHSNVGWLALTLGSLGLIYIGIKPSWLFPLLWLSPLLVILGLQQVWRKHTLFKSLAVGNWCPLVLPALAALICGMFWEMWNVHSLVHWEYTIPFVHTFQIFEMPILGYSGYLPFGLECMAVVELFLGYSVNRSSSQDAPLFHSYIPAWKSSFSNHG